MTYPDISHLSLSSPCFYNQSPSLSDSVGVMTVVVVCDELPAVILGVKVEVVS
jgi:hypothetical protein